MVGLSKLQRRKFGAEFADTYKLNQMDVRWFCEEFEVSTKEALEAGLRIRFLVDSFVEKDIPQQTIEELKILGWGEEFHEEYKIICEQLVKQHNIFLFKEFEDPNSELHQYALLHAKRRIHRMKGDPHEK